MTRQFIRAEPLQACKFVAIVAVLLFSTGAFFGLIPNRRITSLFLIPVLSLALVLVVTAEALVAGYRSIRTDAQPADRFTDRPIYTTVRAGEVVLALLSAGAFGFIVGTLPDGPMAGPGAIGLFSLWLGSAC